MNPGSTDEVWTLWHTRCTYSGGSRGVNRPSMSPVTCGCLEKSDSIWDTQCILIEDIMTSGDLAQGHSIAMDGNFERGSYGSSKTCKRIQISKQGKICAIIKVWQSQISNSCCDLEKRFKVKWLAWGKGHWLVCLFRWTYDLIDGFECNAVK